MRLRELNLSRNRHLTIFEKNKYKKLFDDKTKRMPESLFDELSGIEVLEVEESVGLTIITLDTGKTWEQLMEDRRSTKKSVRHLFRRIGLASALGMSCFKENE